MRKLFPVLLLAAACGPSAKPAPASPANGAGSGSGSGDEWSQYGGVDYGNGYGGGYGNPCGGGYGPDYYGNPCGGGPYFPPQPTPPDISGTWASACAATATKGEYATTTYVDTATTWDVTTATFSDAGCTKRTSALHLAGTYTLDAESATIADAWDGTFTFTARDLTADDKKTAKALGKLCGVKAMKAGKKVDLQTAGCPALGLQPLAACAADNTVVALDNFQLAFGLRPADGNLCTADKRPTALDTSHEYARVFVSTGMPSCDAYVAAVHKYLQCDKIPQAARDGAAQGMAALEASWGDMSAVPDDLKQQTDDACLQAVDGLKQGAAAMGCAM